MMPPLLLQGHAEAQFNLAFFFAEGRGVQRSESNARYLLGLAAAQGHASAQAMLKEMGPASKPGV
jgi:TPR repeat protein